MRGCEIGLVIALCGLATPAAACDASTANQTIDQMQRRIKDGTISHIDVLSFPESINTFRSITPQMMEGLTGRYSIKISRDNASQLSASIGALRPRQEKAPADLRWGFWFLDASGRTLHSIFFDSEYWNARGRRGYIDGNHCNFSSSLIHWVRRQGKLAGWAEQSETHQSTSQQR